MDEVRRSADGELEGFVAADGDGWLALTIFHGVLGREPTRAGAVALVHRVGLASLAERWRWYSSRERAWRTVLPQEAHPGRVRLVVGYYALPGVRTVTVTSDDLAAGDRLELGPVAEGDPSDGR